MNDVPQPSVKRKGPRTAGVTAVGVAAIASAALLLPGTFAGAEPSDSGGGTATEQPEHPIPDLPPLDDNQEYNWQFHLDEGRDSEAAGKYGTAFYDWFAGTDIELPEKPPVQVFDNEIWVDTTADDGGVTGEPTGESLPVYSLSAVDLPDGWTGPLWFQMPGRDVEDVLGLRVWPKASFKQGSGETFEYLANCGDEEELADGMTMLIDNTCAEGEGPNGEKTLLVETVRSEKDTGDVYSKNNVAIVYRADGTAVVASNAIPGHNHSDYPLDPKVDPYLSTGELGELAVSMPDAIVTG